MVLAWYVGVVCPATNCVMTNNLSRPVSGAQTVATGHVSSQEPVVQRQSGDFVDVRSSRPPPLRSVCHACHVVVAERSTSSRSRRRCSFANQNRCFPSAERKGTGAISV